MGKGRWTGPLPAGAVPMARERGAIGTGSAPAAITGGL
jgi:hypothetical protein